MGVMILPASGLVYIDTVTLIYSVERYPVYWPLLEPMWLAGQAGTFEIVSSELILTEALVSPFKTGNTTLERAYDDVLLGSDMRLVPISRPILREAAQLRAATRLKTPDALHAATALLAGCVLFVTNDVGFRGVAGLPLVILDDLRKP
jgi:predicted nucleic acid-binding protein